MVSLAILCILKRVIKSKNGARTFTNVITRGSPDDVHRVFSGIVRLWLESAVEQMEKTSDIEAWGGSVSALSKTTLLEREKASFFQKMHGRDSVLIAVITFVADGAAAMNTAGSRQAMAEAGVLALVLSAFVCKDFKLETLMEPTRRAKAIHRETRDASMIPAPSPMAINTEASTLSVLMHNASFQRNWQGSSFAQRIGVCATLVNSLFPVADTGDQYTITRALFLRIVAHD